MKKSLQITAVCLSKILLFALVAISQKSAAQISFSKNTHLFQNQNVHSGVAIAVLDLNGDGLDDVARLDEGQNLQIEYQAAPNQNFQNLNFGNIYPESVWGMCAGDLDNNGFSDILTGGEYEGVFVIMANADGAGFEVKQLVEPGTFVQSVSFFDINNDGWLDAVVCHDDEISRIFKNDGTGNLDYDPTMMDLATVPSSDNSGNYGAVWSDVNNDGRTDFYIAKCRQGVDSPSDPRRINQLFIQNSDGTFSQDVTNWSGLRIGAQSWTADFGDLDNDGDMDCFITNHDVSSQLLENDGTGVFKDITDAAGLLNEISGSPIQGIFRDFDNDGFLDILVGGDVDFLFKNNGDKTFTSLPNLFDQNNMESFAIGDLNHDGFPDIYAGYAEIYNMPSTTPDALWMNAGNQNHYLGVTLRGTLSNRSAVGSRITIFTPQGKQIREVRSGESYGIQNSLSVIFGLGQNPQVDSVVILWPSGFRDVVKNVVADQYLTISEGGCVSEKVEITALGATTFCSGHQVMLAAPDNLKYLWSTGDTTQNITATMAGNYKVTVTDTAGCFSISNQIKVVVDPIQIPKIEIIGDTLACDGDEIMLVCSPADAYLWSTGDTSKIITVSQSGIYFVESAGMCEVFASQNLDLKFKKPVVPQAIGDTTWVGGSAILKGAGGDEYHWFDALTGGTEIFKGNPFPTPALIKTDTFWLANLDLDDKPNEFAGMMNHSGSNFGNQQFNGQIIFDCIQPFILKTVKVYSTLTRVRQIELWDADGKVLQSKSVNIPNGTTVINLDFDIPIGTDLKLTTNEDVNLQNLNSISPQLRRSDDGVVYPYQIPGVVSLKHSQFGEEFYYYFYNWEVDFYGAECLSERIPVVAFVDPNLVGTDDKLLKINNLEIFPNPAGEKIWVKTDLPEGENFTLKISDSRGKTLRQVVKNLAENQVFEMSVNEFPAGVYFLEILENGRAVRVGRFLVF